MPYSIPKRANFDEEYAHIMNTDKVYDEELWSRISNEGKDLVNKCLTVDPKKRMMFDPNESIQLQGNTGPFIQYTHARIKAILRKADSLGIFVGDADLKNVTSLEKVEREALFLINSYLSKVQEAAKEYSPAVMANYAYDLAKGYNQFYQSVPIFNETDAAKLKFRIAFSSLVATAIKKSMSLLGIQVPERM